MTQRAVEKRFIFHANAVALAAHIRRREEFFVPAIASSCLPATGGIGQAAEPGRDFRGLIAFDSASSSVFGDYSDRARAAEFTHGNHQDNDLPTVTTAEAAVTNLRIVIGNRKVVFGNLRAEMHTYSDRKSPPSFHELAVNFDRITIDDAPLVVEHHCQMFSEQDTKAKLCSTFAKDPNFRTQFVEAFYPTGRKSGFFDLFHGPRIPEANGTILGTVVSRLHFPGITPDRTAIDRNQIHLDGLGTIHFGEILVQENFRRVTLLRFQLGCPDGGEGAAVEIQSNGTGWPPRVGGDDGL